MHELKTLEKLHKQEISLPKAYALMNHSKRPARFVKLKIHQDDKTAQRLLNLLFFLPLPVRPVFFFAKRALSKEDQIFFKEMLIYAKGIKVDIESKDARISLRIY